jgi:hypothetical protein
MSDDKSPKKPKRKYVRRADRNRVLELSLQDILDNARTLSGAGHLHDYIPEDAVVSFVTRNNRTTAVIRWKGYPQDAPDYGDDPSVIREREERRRQADAASGRKDPYDVAA